MQSKEIADPQPVSAAAKAYEHILGSILHGGYRSGDFIEEEPVSSEIGVSRTPIREALRRLAAEKYVELIPRRGARVRDVSPKDLQDYLEARYSLESYSIQIICQRNLRIPENLPTLIDEMTRLATHHQFFEAAELDRQFHRTIVAATGNELLVELYDTLRYQSLLAWLSSPPDPKLFKNVLEEHRALLAALSTHQMSDALELLAAHLEPVQSPRFHVQRDSETGIQRRLTKTSVESR